MAYKKERKKRVRNLQISARSRHDPISYFHGDTRKRRARRQRQRWGLQQHSHLWLLYHGKERRETRVKLHHARQLIRRYIFSWRKVAAPGTCNG